MLPAPSLVILLITVCLSIQMYMVLVIYMACIIKQVILNME